MVALVRRSPMSGLEPWFRPLSLLEELWPHWHYWTSRIGDGDLMPRVDMHEENEELVVRAELPGISRDDIDISVEEDMLTIGAEKKTEEVKEGERGYYLCERCYGRYRRHISLPMRIDADKASSTFDNGVLEIRLPKAEEAKPKKIEVKVS